MRFCFFGVSEKSLSEEAEISDDANESESLSLSSLESSLRLREWP